METSASHPGAIAGSSRKTATTSVPSPSITKHPLATVPLAEKGPPWPLGNSVESMQTKRATLPTPASTKARVPPLSACPIRVALAQDAVWARPLERDDAVPRTAAPIMARTARPNTATRWWLKKFNLFTCFTCVLLSLREWCHPVAKAIVVTLEITYIRVTSR